jgi:hypothetical protein
MGGGSVPMKIEEVYIRSGKYDKGTVSVCFVKDGNEPSLYLVNMRVYFQISCHKSKEEEWL